MLFVAGTIPDQSSVTDIFRTTLIHSISSIPDLRLQLQVAMKAAVYGTHKVKNIRGCNLKAHVAYLEIVVRHRITFKSGRGIKYTVHIYRSTT